MAQKMGLGGWGTFLALMAGVFALFGAYWLLGAVTSFDFATRVFALVAAVTAVGLLLRRTRA